MAVHETFNGARRALRPRRFLNVLALALGFSACSLADNLLEVELPGQVSSADLDDPVFAETLSLSAQGDFECALSNHIAAMGIWVTDFNVSATTRTRNIFSLRDQSVLSVSSLGSASGQPSCRETNPHPIAMALHVARVQAKSGIEYLSGFDVADVPDKTFLIGKTHIYEGYSVELLSETMCALTLDGGPELTRAQGFENARGHFTEALNLLGSVTSGSREGEARTLENVAKIGYARASLQLGDRAGVLLYASDIPAGFIYNADRQSTSTQTRNHVYDLTVPGLGLAVHASMRDLTVSAQGLLTQADGVPDPRVPSVDANRNGGDQVTPQWNQLKYNSWADDIPFATWREMQLMIAEVELAAAPQTTVGIINTLRTDPTGIYGTLDASAWPLPTFSSTDPAEIRGQLIEERHRELWVQGTRQGDMLRFGVPYATGTTPKGEFYGTFTCIPLEDRETFNNSNFTS